MKQQPTRIMRTVISHFRQPFNRYIDFKELSFSLSLKVLNVLLNVNLLLFILSNIFIFLYFKTFGKFLEHFLESSITFLFFFV